MTAKLLAALMAVAMMVGPALAQVVHDDLNTSCHWDTAVMGWVCPKMAGAPATGRPAFAQSGDIALPIYDVDGICAAIHSTVYGNYRTQAARDTDKTMAIRRCIFNEQEAYDKLKMLWPRVLPITLTRCLNTVADNPKYNLYTELEYCVQLYAPIDSDAAQPPKQTEREKFRP
jgi:hypothetical protein